MMKPRARTPQPWLRLAAGASLCLALAGAASAGEIVLGMSAAFTGPSRGLGIELYRGSQAYLEHINRHGGVNGNSVKLEVRDDGYNPVPAIQNTRSFVESGKPFLLMNYVGTPTVLRVLPLLKMYQDRQAYLFFPFTGAQTQREAPYDAYVFNLRASYREETRGLVDHFVQSGRKRIAIFYQVDAYGRSGWDGVRRALMARNLKMAGEATYRRGAKYADSMRPQVEILRQSQPDAVICIGAYAACAAFIRDARTAGWDVPIANVSFVGSEAMLTLLQQTEQETKRDLTRNLINSQVVPSYHDISLPAVREYRELMDRNHPDPPRELVKESYAPLKYSFVSFEGYLNAKLTVEILRRLGKNPDRRRIRQTVEGISSYDLGLGTPVRFSSTRHEGLGIVYYTTVKDGEFIPVRDWSAWKVARK